MSGWPRSPAINLLMDPFMFPSVISDPFPLRLLSSLSLAFYHVLLSCITLFVSFSAMFPDYTLPALY